jgi:hypothetical protein
MCRTINTKETRFKGIDNYFVFPSFIILMKTFCLSNCYALGGTR